MPSPGSTERASSPAATGGLQSATLGSTGGLTQNVDFDKIIQLFTGPNSSDLYERHVSAVERLCKSSSSGFAIRDLPKVQQVLELTLQLLKRGLQEFLAPATSLIK